MTVQNASGIFNRFAGREVGVREKQERMQGFNGSVFIADATAFSSAEPVFREIEEVANEAGLKMRVWFPGAPRIAVDDIEDSKRVNVRVEKAPDGKYRIGSKFTIG